MSLAILFHFLCAQHVSDINISIIRSKFIPEQSLEETNPLFQTVINPQPPHTTWTEQLCFSLQNEHHSKSAATNLQHAMNWGMYDLKFT